MPSSASISEEDFYQIPSAAVKEIAADKDRSVKSTLILIYSVALQFHEIPLTSQIPRKIPNLLCLNLKLLSFPRFYGKLSNSFSR